MNGAVNVHGEEKSASFLDRLLDLLLICVH